ncbi:uncharacterized protein MYCGRDRAFT_104488 [Zymoseptoria tritici IPO323]|uniref:Uncharacterized protein n=1 Tax=Zymoseptoria tritici (strain CBS 115943 / IPO323) TaxID=336722 RepID=F9XC10_ZYMTI|nr:uncharacterized protein MYCGRDRAFT_104488 [Zymoseptoria tritici IPO323]EGP87153.1 hypothetical protein MYCGRDRAFT_104488 [Zymoseptoria tritici IPO323]
MAVPLSVLHILRAYWDQDRHTAVECKDVRWACVGLTYGFLSLGSFASKQPSVRIRDIRAYGGTGRSQYTVKRARPGSLNPSPRPRIMHRTCIIEHFISATIIIRHIVELRGSDHNVTHTSQQYLLSSGRSINTVGRWRWNADRNSSSRSEGFEVA